MMSFYLALHSGSSFKFFPVDTLANFSMKLYEAVNLKGDCECGVVEMSYPYTFYNVEDEELSLTRVVHDGRGDQSAVPPRTKFSIPVVTTIQSRVFKRSK